MQIYAYAKTFIVLLILWTSSFTWADDTCTAWFKNSKIDPADKGCILKCDTLPKDMSTFMCADQCDQFCKPQNCKDDSFWVSKVQNGSPSNWDIPGEKSKI